MNGRTIIVTGGAGYLGRCAVEVLRERGFRPFVVDNFSASHRESLEGVDFAEADLCDLAKSREAFRKAGSAHAVIHFAALALVEESVRQPERYLKNNVGAAETVARLCGELGIGRLIHSSSCAVYGFPKEIPVKEGATFAPSSPYGESKVRAEAVLGRFRSPQLRVINLRYFNPVGAIGRFGERHDPETHLIPRVIEALRGGQPVSVFGRDYETPDGTCVRDFVHVKDLIEAHLAAMEWLERGVSTEISAVNLGSGVGRSVLEVIKTAEKALSLKAEIAFLPRRPGDPARLMADVELAEKLFGWRPRLGIDQMIRDHAQFIFPFR